MPFADLKAKFDHSGYCVAKGVIKNGALDALQKELIEIINGITKACYSSYQDPRLVEDFMKDPHRVTQIYDALQRFSSLVSLSTSSGIVALVRGILGLEVGCLYKMPFRIDVPFVTKELAHWHQDYFYVQGNTEIVTAWVPFQDTRWEHGCPSVMPESHRLGVLDHSRRVGKRNIPENIFENEIRYIEINRGDVLFCHSLLLHSSNLNISNQVRYSVQFRYSKLNLVTHPSMGEVTPLKDGGT